MTRAEAREIAIQLCFAGVINSQSGEEIVASFFEKEYFSTLGNEGFYEKPSAKQIEYITSIVLGVLEYKDEIDGYIEKYSKGWKLPRISKTALAVMRVSIYEIFALDDVPTSVAISEAVEIAKGFEEPETVAFINGVLGSFSRSDDVNRVLGEMHQCAIDEILQTAEDMSAAAIYENLYAVEEPEEEVDLGCENQITLEEITE